MLHWLPLLLALVLQGQATQQTATGGRVEPADRERRPGVSTSSAGLEAPRVRGVNGYSQWLVNAAIDRSPTVADMARRLEQTDTVVYVRMDMTGGRFESYTRLIGTGQRRYVMISLSKTLRPARKIELLGHELQHVVEIATDPRARDARALRALFARIGEEHAYNHFETAEARQAANAVWRRRPRN